ncbi:MAG: GTP-binding protein [Clostridia bacterium]|nr:GTP-binding protein [Clostridia bacterium]
MTKIDIFSGFLGAGKTTLIKKLIAEAYSGEKLVLIENEFGDIGIDGGFLQDAGVNITEMNSGCICCSLVGDFGKALKQVITDYAPDRVLIEPSGVGKLSDVIRAVEDIDMPGIVLNAFTAVVDVNKCKMYMKNFGEFFNNQIVCASAIILSHTTGTSDAKLTACVELLREHNQTADILTTPWEQLTGAQILEVLEKKNTLEDELKQLTEEAQICPTCGHHHKHDEHCHCECDHEHHHEHDEHCHCECDHEHHHEHNEHCHCECEHEHHHEHGEHCHCECEHEHHHEHDEHCHCECEHEHHHEHDEHCHCECEHEHHHEHGEHCHCGHDHDHHHHHADEVFTSFGAETGRCYTTEEITNALTALEDEEKYGIILRAKGIVNGTEGFIHFDYVPGEPDVRSGSAAPTGRLCVIGANIHEDALKELFQL